MGLELRQDFFYDTNLDRKLLTGGCGEMFFFFWYWKMLVVWRRV
jgi:hypothetical protein